MRKLVMTIGIALLSIPAHTPAAVQVEIQMGLPAVLPPLVVVQPGVQVVSDYDQEIFFAGGYYWARRGPYWYRAADYRSRWAYVPVRRVPASLVQIPPGRYRHWHGEPPGHARGRGHHGERGRHGER